MTPEDDGITFEVDRLTAGTAGRIEVSGRWYGVRGRRFVRPSLTLTLRATTASNGCSPTSSTSRGRRRTARRGSRPSRSMASSTAAERIELAVAPDITVELAGGSGPRVNTGRAADLRPAGSTRSPVCATIPPVLAPAPPGPRRSCGCVNGSPLAESLITRERTRRQTAEEAVETERQAARTLQAEVGRLRAELDLAGAVQRELDTASAGLDGLRGQVRELGRERDQLAAHRDEVAARARRRSGPRPQRLAGQLADAEAAVRRLTQAGREASATPDAAARGEAGERAVPVRGPGRAGTGRAASGEASGADRRPAGPARRGDRAPDAAERPSGPERAAGRSRPLPRTDRPVNPSLRGSNWLGRGIALVVFVIVVVAVIIVINSTIA